jgi:hypothetical protein
MIKMIQSFIMELISIQMYQRLYPYDTFTHDGTRPIRTASSMMDDAAHDGFIDILEVLKSKGVKMNNRTSAYAACGKSFEALKWVYDNGGELNPQTFQSACTTDNIEALQWLLDHKCPWNGECIRIATLHQRTKTLEWLRSNGCPED